MSAIIKTCKICGEDYVKAGPVDNGCCSVPCYRLSLARERAARPALSALKASEGGVLVKPDPKGHTREGWDI